MNTRKEKGGGTQWHRANSSSKIWIYASKQELAIFSAFNLQVLKINNLKKKRSLVLPLPYPWVCLAKLLTTASTASLRTVLALASVIPAAAAETAALALPAPCWAAIPCPTGGLCLGGGGAGPMPLLEAIISSSNKQLLKLASIPDNNCSGEGDSRGRVSWTAVVHWYRCQISEFYIYSMISWYVLTIGMS